MPAQPLLRAPSLVDDVVAVVDEQLQLPRRLLAGARTVELGLLQRSPGDGERVDRVGLAAATAASTLRRRQPWRHPYQPLALTEQCLLEPTRDDNTTQFTLLLPTIGLDYGDIPDPVGGVPGRAPSLQWSVS